MRWGGCQSVSMRCASFRELRFEQASSRSPLSPLSRQRCSPRQALRVGVAHAAASTRAPTPQLALPSRATKGVDASVSTRPSPPPPPALALALAHLSKGADAGTASTRFDCLPISRSLSSDEPAAAAPVPDHRPTIGVLRAEDAKWTDLLARKWTDLLPDLLADGPNLRLRPVTAFVRGVSHEQHVAMAVLVCAPVAPQPHPPWSSALPCVGLALLQSWLHSEWNGQRSTPRKQRPGSTPRLSNNGPQALLPP